MMTPEGPALPEQRSVFLVHGRDSSARTAVVELLEAFKLNVIGWNQASTATKQATPYTGDVVAAGMDLADAVVVLFTPDDLGSVKERFRERRDGPAETELTGQARQNVVFEAGMAMARNRAKVVLVEFGYVRPISDTDGLNMVRLEDTELARERLAERLRTAGLTVDTDNDSWATAGDIASAASTIDEPGTPALSTPPTSILTGEPKPVDVLKSSLPDPTQYIKVVDLIESTVEEVVAGVAAQPFTIQGLDPAGYGRVLNEHRELVEPLLDLIVLGIKFDRDDRFQDLWVNVVQRLLQARKTPMNGQPYHGLLDRARHYPALLALRAAGLAALINRKDELFLRLANEPQWRDPFGAHLQLPAHAILHDYFVLEADWVNDLPWWEYRLLYPISHLLRTSLRTRFNDLIPDDEDYLWASDRFEYKLAIVQYTTADDPGHYRSAPGEFLLRRRWNTDGVLHVQSEFTEGMYNRDESWPWWAVLGGQARAYETIQNLNSELRKLRRES